MRNADTEVFMAEIEISEINGLAKCDSMRLIENSEARYKNFTDEVATRVAENENVRIVLLAGPSGSGKTTTANLLADRLREKGLFALVISLDDFYRDATDPKYPRLSNGERDFEAVEALNLPDLEETLLAVSRGEEFTIPKYDFKVGGRTLIKKHPKISHGCVIIEGLHALNPKISEHLPADKLMKIFISVSTNINADGKRILSGRKLRFARRMVRDSLYRAADAERTLGLWENVLLGEEKYLYPYRSLADVEFNTFHDFEPCVMRKYAEALISDELAKKSEYANTVLSALRLAEPIDEAMIPDDSLIREFIVGGIYEEFY